jgi:hypothetical protein
MSERTARINYIPIKGIVKNDNPFASLDNKEYKKNFIDLYMGK